MATTYRRPYEQNRSSFDQRFKFGLTPGQTDRTAAQDRFLGPTNEQQADAELARSRFEPLQQGYAQSNNYTDRQQAAYEAISRVPGVLPEKPQSSTESTEEPKKAFEFAEPSGAFGTKTQAKPTETNSVSTVSGVGTIQKDEDPIAAEIQSYGLNVKTVQEYRDQVAGVAKQRNLSAAQVAMYEKANVPPQIAAEYDAYTKVNEGSAATREANRVESEQQLKDYPDLAKMGYAVGPDGTLVVKKGNQIVSSLDLKGLSPAEQQAKIAEAKARAYYQQPYGSMPADEAHFDHYRELAKAAGVTADQASKVLERSVNKDTLEESELDTVVKMYASNLPDSGAGNASIPTGAEDEIVAETMRKLQEGEATDLDGALAETLQEDPRGITFDSKPAYRLVYKSIRDKMAGALRSEREDVTGKVAQLEQESMANLNSIASDASIIVADAMTSETKLKGFMADPNFDPENLQVDSPTPQAAAIAALRKMFNKPNPADEDVTVNVIDHLGTPLQEQALIGAEPIGLLYRNLVKAYSQGIPQKNLADAERKMKQNEEYSKEADSAISMLSTDTSDDIDKKTGKSKGPKANIIVNLVSYDRNNQPKTTPQEINDAYLIEHAAFNDDEQAQIENALNAKYQNLPPEFRTQIQQAFRKKMDRIKERTGADLSNWALAGVEDLRTSLTEKFPANGEAPKGAVNEAPLDQGVNAVATPEAPKVAEVATPTVEQPAEPTGPVTLSPEKEKIYASPEFQKNLSKAALNEAISKIDASGLLGGFHSLNVFVHSVNPDEAIQGMKDSLVNDHGLSEAEASQIVDKQIADAMTSVGMKWRQTQYGYESDAKAKEAGRQQVIAGREAEAKDKSARKLKADSDAKTKAESEKKKAIQSLLGAR